MKKDFYIVDFEFTQYRKPKGRPVGFFSEIIELGAVKLNGETLEDIAQDHCFVVPKFYPEQLKDVAEFCMITDKEMEQAIDFKDMVDHIKSLYIPGKTYFVAWGEEDYRVLNKGCEKHGIDNPVLYEDYLDFAAWYKWEMGDSYTTGLRNAVQEQCIEANILWHTAVDDAINTGKLLATLVKDGWDPNDFIYH